MFSFRSHEDALQNHELASSGDSSMTSHHALGQHWSNLVTEERPRSMLLLSTLMVMALHAGLWSWLTQEVETETPAKPLVMQVSMIAMSAPKPAVAPPKPAPLPPPEKKLPPPPKTPPKPVVRKPPPVVQKAPDFAPSEPVSEPQPPSPAPPSPPAVTSSNSSTTSDAKAAPAAPPADSFTEANFRANYAQNPKPDYPAVAKSRGWTGKVLLKVQVSAQGTSDSVAIEQSSGHEILDESAVEAVKKWRFIPAKRGETPVASSVIVPIVFSLRN